MNSGRIVTTMGFVLGLALTVPSVNSQGIAQQPIYLYINLELTR